ncbi:5'/3'-nucleotidase SurE [Oryzibacter oryziterrae]|uniref:5'/3'-nucleotidase SurE n=1 Tax=Oryzibacter oryziterrae TaxID=2766474 RepID=UPI001F005F86|nr:5'/3'-nucleotidase SurE [Oryzibacter oryziterrae]
MRILISNDDGFGAPGILALERVARQLTDDVWVVAPETDQSGLAHSLTLHDPLRAREIDNRHFAVRGTPTDCVIMAIRQLMPDAPDLVLSGINAGANIADDVTYSGTVACAIEATLLGVPAIALSQAYDWGGNGTIPYDTAEAHAGGILKRVWEQGIRKGTLVNVNFPDCAPDRVAGVEVTRQGTFDHGIKVDARVDARKKAYYWLAYARGECESAVGTDAYAIDNKRISVTPMRLDLTDHDGLSRLKSAF